MSKAIILLIIVFVLILILVAVLCHNQFSDDDVKYIKDHKPRLTRKHEKKCEEKKCEEKKIGVLDVSVEDTAIIRHYAESKCLKIEVVSNHDDTSVPIIHKATHVMYKGKVYYTNASYTTYLRGLLNVVDDYDKTHRCGPKKVLQVFIGQIDEQMARETADALQFKNYEYEAYIYRPGVPGSAEELNFKAADSSLVYVYGDHGQVDAVLDVKYELAVADPGSAIVSTDRLYAFITFNQYSLEDPHVLSLYELVDLAASLYCDQGASKSRTSKSEVSTHTSEVHAHYKFTSARGVAALSAETGKTYRRVQTYPSVFYVPDVSHEQYFIKVGFVSNCMHHGELFMQAAMFAQGAKLNVSVHIDVNGDDHNEIIEHWIETGHRIIIVDIPVDAGLEHIIKQNTHVLFILNKSWCVYGNNTVTNGVGSSSDVLRVAAMYPHIHKVQAYKSTGSALFAPLHVDVVDTVDFYCESFVFLPACHQSRVLSQYLDLEDREDAKVIFITDGEPSSLVNDNAKHLEGRYYSVQRVPTKCYDAHDQIINAVSMTLYAAQCIDEAVACAVVFLKPLIPCFNFTRIISIKCGCLHTEIVSGRLVAYVDYQRSRLHEAGIISKYLHMPLITLKLKYGDECKKTEDAYNLHLLKQAYNAGVRVYIGFSGRLAGTEGVRDFIEHHKDIIVITEGSSHTDGIMLLESENTILERLVNHVSSDALYILPESMCVNDLAGDVLKVGDHFKIDDAVAIVDSHKIIIFHSDLDELIIEVFKHVTEHKTFYRFGDTLFNSHLIKHVPDCVKYHEVLPALAGVEYCDTIIDNSQAVEAVILSHMSSCPLQFIRYVQGPRDKIVLDCLRRVEQLLFIYDFEDCKPIEKCSISVLDPELNNACLL